MRSPFLLAILALILIVLPASAQLGGLPGSIKGKLDQAEADRDQQIRDAAGDTPKPAADPDTGWIERPTPPGSDIPKVRLYVSHPDYSHSNGAPNLPALIVLQEWWGVNDDIKQRVEDFAAKGYFAVAVDLYDGKVTADPKEAPKLHAGLTDAGAMLRMKVGLDYLTERAGKKIVDPAKIGAVGWCMGGGCALQLAIADPRIKATAIFYGPLVTDSAKLKTIKGPVLGIFGNDDKSITPDQVNKFEAALKEANVPNEIHRYDNAGHAFASQAAAIMGAYKPDLAKDAWAKFYAWLDKNLPPRK